jgi:opacity protein-like surface antigen
MGGWNLHAGLTAGYLEAHVKESSVGFSGDFQVPFAGAYVAATYGGFYIDGLVRGDFYQNRLNFPNGGLVNQESNARAITFSSSAGYNANFGSWFLEPSAGVIYSRMSVDSISSAGDKYTDCGIPPQLLLVPCTNPAGSGVNTPGTVSFNDIESLLGRVGLRAGTAIPSGDLVLVPYVSVNVWREFSGNVTAPFSTCVSCAFRGDQLPGVLIPVTTTGTVSTSRVGTYGQYTIGVLGSIANTGWLGYARLDYKNGDDIEGLSVNVGLRYQFNPSAPPIAAGKGLVTKAPPAALQVAHNWTGFYIGGFVGAAFGSSDWRSLDNGDPIGLDFGGFLGGGQAGYNHQIGSWVLGIEGDVGWTNARGAGTDPKATDGTVFIAGVGPSPFAFDTRPICTTRIDVSCQTSVSLLATLAGRVGYAWDRALFYAKGGAAWMEGHNETFDNYRTIGHPLLGVGPICHCTLGAANGDRFGWAIGGGVEYAFTPNWSVKGEYMYLDFGNRQLTFSDGERWNISDRFSEVKLGLNYRFSGLLSGR